jgi:hypothetical protein
MPEIEIRPAISSDLPVLIKFDHSVETTHVCRWIATLM